MFTHADMKAQTMLIKLIPKPNKDNYDTLDKYRPINLSNLISRSLFYIINQRLMTVLKNYPILTGLNFAYQQGKSKHDMVQQIKDSLSIAKANNMEDFTILNLDLKAAFDSPNNSYLQETCRYIGFPNKLTNYFDLLHKKTNAIILDTNLDPIPIQSGVFQGQSSAGATFLITIAPLLLALQKAKTLKPLSITYSIATTPDSTATLSFKPVIAFSDDINILARIKVNRQGQSQILDIFERYERTSGIGLAQDKTIIYSYKKTSNIHRLTANKKCKTKKQVRVLVHTFQPYDLDKHCFQKFELDIKSQANMLNFTKKRIANNFIFRTYLQPKIDCFFFNSPKIPVKTLKKLQGKIDKIF